MRRILFYLLLLSLFCAIIAISIKSYKDSNDLVSLKNTLEPVKRYLSEHAIISFAPTDSLELYFQCQFILAPTLLDRKNQTDTILVFEKPFDKSDVKYNHTIWEATFNDSVIRLKSRK